MEAGPKETGRNQVTLTLMFTENSRYSDISGKIKKDLETTLPGLQIKIKMVELNETLERAFDHNYDMFYQSWQPSCVDPLAFIVNGGMEHLREDYHNPEYRNNLEKAAACGGDFSKRRGSSLRPKKIWSERMRSSLRFFSRKTGTCLIRICGASALFPMGRPAS